MTSPAPSDPADTADRLTDLERHVAHLEATQQDLSDIIARQWDQIDRLTRAFHSMHERLQSVEPAPESRPPPHY